MSFLLLLLLMVNICLGATNPYENNADYFNPIIHDHQIQIANNFLFNHVQSLMINNYRKYYQILFNNNVNTSSYVKTINDQNCLQLLKQTLIHPLETEWSAKCECYFVVVGKFLFIFHFEFNSLHHFIYIISFQ